MGSAEKSIPISDTVLLLIDFINPLDFEGAEDLSAGAAQAARATATLKERLHRAGVPAIYANDNYGSWQSDFNSLVSHLCAAGGTSADMVRMIAPHQDDLTILKPRHSAFYGTPLALLLDKMQAKRLIITGLATDICVQFTAMDAFLRGYAMQVPSDCTAAESARFKRQSLEYMRRTMQCDITPSPGIQAAS